MNDVTIYTDGACSGNPGPGGYGVILQSGKYEKEISGGEPMTLAEFRESLEQEKARLEKELANAEKQLAGQIAKLSNENFVTRAPENVVNVEREKKARLESLIENLKASLASLGI